MCKPLAFAALGLLCAWATLARADEITLKNGDRVTGQIIKKDGGKLTVKVDLMDTVTIAWENVTSISSKEPLVVVLPDGRSVVGTLSTNSDGRLEVATPTTRETVALAEVKAIRNAAEQKAYDRLLAPGWLDLWAGYFDFGLSGTQGNAKALALTNAFNASRVTRTDRTTLHFNQIYARATVEGRSAATARAVRGGWSYDRGVTSKLFINTFNDYEYDRFQDLDLRFVLGGGLGYSAIKTERTRLDLPAGFSYNHEKFTTSTRNSGEAYWGDDFSYKLSSLVSLTQSFRMFPNLTNTGEYRMNFDAGAVTKLARWLSWQITLSDRFLSNPVAGRQRNDFLYSTGIRVSFAR